MKKKIICIIPALEKNIYSHKGDLANWGDTTLLEWKISQAQESKIFDKIYVSTPSIKISQIIKKIGIPTIKRKNESNVLDLYSNALKLFPESTLIFLSTTFPFISPKIINKIIRNFNKKKYEAGFTSFNMNEYFFFKNKPLNFNYKEELKSRRKIKSLKKIVPAVTIIKSSKNSNIKNIFKDKNYFFEIDWLESLEINTPKDLDVFNLLIKEYLKKI